MTVVKDDNKNGVLELEVVESNVNTTSLYCALPQDEHINGDVADSMPTKLKFTWVDILINLWCIFFYMFDIATDCALAYFYYVQGNWHYFGLTLCFVVLPSLAINAISLKWYLDDRSDKEKGNLSTSAWIVVLVFHILNLAPVIRYIKTLNYGIRSWKTQDRRLLKLMLWEVTDVCLLRLIEGFLESAPQLVLQLYILARNHQTIRWHIETAFIAGVPHNFVPANKPANGKSISRIADMNDISKQDPFLGSNSQITVIIQVLSIVISLVSLAWCLTSYARNSRYVMENKRNMSILATICHFLWHLFTIAARVFAMALFASVFSFWVGVGCAFRWIVMVLWIDSTKINLCGGKQCEDLFFKCVLGFVYLYTFLNVKDVPTRHKYLFFYLYDFVENTIMIGLWIYFGDHTTWFYYPAATAQFCTFILGLTFMFLYYSTFHPSLNFKISDCSKFYFPTSDKRRSLRAPDRKQPHRASSHDLAWVDRKLIKRHETV